MRTTTKEREDNEYKPIILNNDEGFRKLVDIGSVRTCDCGLSNLNCMTAKEWLKSQIGVWEFYYEKRDIRNKELHPATFPISLARKVIELFTHEGELVLDPFVGSGTTLVAAADSNRNALGFDLHEKYVRLSVDRLTTNNLFNKTKQIAIQDDARYISDYIQEETVKLIFTSPPYANLLNRKRKNKSRRDRDNGQLGKVEQYSQDERDLGTLAIDEYSEAMVK
jgi:DNA modification methylase